MNLFDVTKGCNSLGHKPRNATPDEVRAYLQWIAAQEGVAVPKNAEYHPAGIWSPTAREYIVAMPGHGQSQVVICELLDDAGEVVRSMPLPRDKRGGIPATAKQVQEWTGLKPVKAKRAKVAAPTVEVIAAPMVAIASPEPAQDSPEVSSAPVEAELPVAPVGDLDAITARLEALEQALATLSAVQGATLDDTLADDIQDTPTARAMRSPAHERAIRRAWAERKGRRAARFMAELKRDQLDNANRSIAYWREQAETWQSTAATYQGHLGRDMDKRLASAQRARRMIASARARADLDSRALTIANATVARLKRDMADPSQPERASDIARLVAERDTARTALAAMAARAERAEQSVHAMADRFEGLVSRVAKAEAALRVQAA